MKIDSGKDFGVRECPSCATEIPANHNKCPICGYHFPVLNPLQKNMKIWGALIMLGIIALLLIWGWL